jgi:hypothetical protein
VYAYAPSEDSNSFSAGNFFLLWRKLKTFLQHKYDEYFKKKNTLQTFRLHFYAFYSAAHIAAHELR